MSSLCVDGITNVRLFAGVVRFDLLTFISGPGQETRLEKNGAHMLSVPGFVGMRGQLTDVVNKRVKDCVFKKEKKEPHIADSSAI